MEMNTKLGGYLIGYGIKKKNGEIKQVIFDKPIHNTITKHCLNNLLTFDGTDTTPTGNYLGNYLSLFVKSSQASERYGVFNSSALGDGTGSTNTNDGDLKHRVSDCTREKKTGSGWCGTYTDLYPNSIIRLRISHKHTITDSFTVKEIGWYNENYTNHQYLMTARVILDYPVPVEAGEEFYSIYELHLTVDPRTKFNIAGYEGIKEAFGVPCRATYAYDTQNYFPTHNENCIPSIGDKMDKSCSFFPIYLATRSANPYNGAYEKQNWLKDPGLKTDAPGSYWYTTNNFNALNYTANVKPYVADSFYRDVDFVFSKTWTNDLWGFAFLGTLYRFGTFSGDTFTPSTVQIDSALKITVRQSWSTDQLAPSA